MKGRAGYKLYIILIFLISLVLTTCAGFDDKTRFNLESSVKNKFSKFVTVRGVRIHYYDLVPREANPPTMVLVHGWMGSAYDFTNILRLFPPEFRVIAVDLPGCGLSESWEFGKYKDVGSLVTFLRDFTDVLGIKKFVLVGHSMGGIITINFTVSYPSKVEKLILVSPDGLEGEEGIWMFFGRLGPITDLLSIMNNRFFMDMGMRLNVFYDNSKITKGLLDSVVLTALTENGRRVQLAITRNIVGRAHVDNLLSLIDKPTLIIWGRNDKVLSVKWARKFREGIKGSRLVILDKCGHMAMFEKPYVTAREINAFLRTKR